MSQPAPPQRIHAMDSLRAVAMLLGVLMHAGLPYSRNVPVNWISDPRQNFAFDIFRLVSHAFRMEVFFIVAGFFAYLLYRRIGLRAFVRHRLQRIAVPLAVAWVTVLPALGLVRALYAIRTAPAAADPAALTAGPSPLTAGVPAITAGPSWLTASTTNPSLLAQLANSPYLGWSEMFWRPVHLWFLEYLLIYYALMLVAERLLAGRVPGAWLGWVDRGTRAWIRSRARPVILAVPVLAALCLQPHWIVDGTANSPIPSVGHLVYYALFFAIGLLLYRVRGDLARLAEDWEHYLLLALAGVFPLFFLLLNYRARSQGMVDLPTDWAGRVLSALFTSLLVMGVTGFFLARYTRPNATMRYLADASYWLYLVHLPLVGLISVWLLPLSWSPFAKVSVVLAIAVPILLLSYQFCVRHTFIGHILNGPRERSRPKPEPQSAEVELAAPRSG